MKKILLCSLIICLLPSWLLADTLSLDECLSLARTQNPTLRVSRMDTDIAAETIRQSDAALFPRIDAQGGYATQLEAQAMKVGGQVMETQQPNYLYGNLNLQYTLYDFGRRDAKRAISRSSADTVRLGIQQQELDINLQLVETYLGILEAQKYVGAAIEELKTVEEHRRVALALYEAGSVTRNDLLQADVRLSNARQLLIMHRNLVNNLYLRLNFLIGRPAANRPELDEPAISPLQQQTVFDSPAVLLQRPDLNSLRSNVLMSEQQLRESRTAFYPELFTSLSLDYLQNDKLREQTLYTAGVGVRINLFDGFASTSNRSKAVAVHAKAKEQLRLAEQQAQLELTTYQNDLQVAFERIAVTKEAIKQGEENLRINQSRYQERVGTATEVLDAQTLLTQARTEQFLAIYDYQLAAARLRKASGKL